VDVSDEPVARPNRIKLTVRDGNFVREDSSDAAQLVEAPNPPAPDTPMPTRPDLDVEQVLWTPALRKSLDGTTKLPADSGLLPGGITGVGDGGHGGGC
jgi:hypothetical protein